MTDGLCQVCGGKRTILGLGGIPISCYSCTYSTPVKPLHDLGIDKDNLPNITPRKNSQENKKHFGDKKRGHHG